jgi:archaellum component FlaD/FlaE
MFEKITRLFSADDTDSENKSEDGPEQEPRVDLSGERVDANDQNLAADGQNLAAAEQNDGDELDVAEVDVRVDELEERLDSTESSLRALRNSQEEMAGSIEEMNDTVRQLVGVYDRLTAEENPFIDDAADSAESSTTSPMTEVSGDASTHSPAGDDTPSAGKASAEKTDIEIEDGDPVVSFDDLVEQIDDDRAEGDQDPEDIPTEIESPTTHDSNQSSSEGQDSASLSPVEESGRSPVLVSVPQGYAGDILVMEWLATLMDSSGPAGALRAVNQYEDMRWISSEVRNHLVDVIGGPALDVFVDPTRSREPTADEHAVSHEYIRVLNRLTEI